MVDSFIFCAFDLWSIPLVKTTTTTTTTFFRDLVFWLCVVLLLSCSWWLWLLNFLNEPLHSVNFLCFFRMYVWHFDIKITIYFSIIIRPIIIWILWILCVCVYDQSPSSLSWFLFFTSVISTLPLLQLRYSYDDDILKNSSWWRWRQNFYHVKLCPYLFACFWSCFVIFFCSFSACISCLKQQQHEDFIDSVHFLLSVDECFIYFIKFIYLFVCLSKKKTVKQTLNQETDDLIYG